MLVLVLVTGERFSDCWLYFDSLRKVSPITTAYGLEVEATIILFNLVLVLYISQLVDVSGDMQTE